MNCCEHLCIVHAYSANLACVIRRVTSKTSKGSCGSSRVPETSPAFIRRTRLAAVRRSDRSYPIGQMKLPRLSWPDSRRINTRPSLISTTKHRLDVHFAACHSPSSAETHRRGPADNTAPPRSQTEQIAAIRIAPSSERATPSFPIEIARRLRRPITLCGFPTPQRIQSLRRKLRFDREKPRHDPATCHRLS